MLRNDMVCSDLGRRYEWRDDFPYYGKYFPLYQANIRVWQAAVPRRWNSLTKATITIICYLYWYEVFVPDGIVEIVQIDQIDEIVQTV
jgi:hypothetical protein